MTLQQIIILVASSLGGIAAFLAIWKAWRKYIEQVIKEQNLLSAIEKRLETPNGSTVGNMIERDHKILKEVKLTADENRELYHSLDRKLDSHGNRLTLIEGHLLNQKGDEQ